jgi:5-methylthioadenosine/S-adenosylhomocysteine deaminase
MNSDNTATENPKRTVAQKSGNPDQPKQCDLIIRNARIFTLDKNRAVYGSGAIAVADGRIAAVGPEVEVLRAFRARRNLDANGAPTHPGYVDAHIHMSLHSSRGFGALVAANHDSVVNFADWKAALTDEDEYASATLACLDLVRNGYTSFVDPGTSFSPEATAQAATLVGMRGWLTDPYLWDQREVMDCMPRLISPALANRVPFDLGRVQRELGGQLFRNQEPDALVRGYVALYGLGTASDELQLTAKECANRNGVTFAQHGNFVRKMTEFDEARLKGPVIAHLIALGVVDANTTFAHMNLIRDSEIEALIDADPSIVWCPANYLIYAASDGIRGRMGELRRRGMKIALGIDSATNCAVGDTGVFALHASTQAGDVVPAGNIFEMQTIHAARSIGASNEIGSLEVGKRADIVIRRQATPDAQPGLNAMHQLVALGRAPSVDTVIINGEIVMRHGFVANVDEDAVFADVQASVTHMMDRLGLRFGGEWPETQ